MIKNLLFFILLTCTNLIFGNDSKIGHTGSMLDNSELVAKFKIKRGYENFLLLEPLKIYHGELNDDSVWIQTNRWLLNKGYAVNDTVIFFLDNQIRNNTSNLVLSYYGRFDQGLQKVRNDSVFYYLDTYYGDRENSTWHSMSEYEELLAVVYQQKNSTALIRKILLRLSNSQSDAHTIHDLKMLCFLGLSEYNTIFNEIKTSSNPTVILSLITAQLSIEQPETYALLSELIQKDNPILIATLFNVLSRKKSEASIQLILKIIDLNNDGKLSLNELQINDKKRHWLSASTRINNCETPEQIVATGISALIILKHDKMYPLLEELSYTNDENIASSIFRILHETDLESWRRALNREINTSTHSRVYFFELLQDLYYLKDDSITAKLEHYFFEHRQHDEVDIFLLSNLAGDSSKHQLYRDHLREMLQLEPSPDNDYGYWLDEATQPIYYGLVSGLKVDLYNASYPLCGISYDYVQDTTLFAQKKKQELAYTKEIQQILAQDNTDSILKFKCYALLDTALYRKNGLVKFENTVVMNFPYNGESYIIDYDQNKVFLKNRVNHYSKLFQLPTQRITAYLLTWFNQPIDDAHDFIQSILEGYLGAYGDQKDIDFLKNLLYYYPNEKVNYEQVIKEITELRL